jgi:hypothetical protein
VNRRPSFVAVAAAVASVVALVSGNARAGDARAGEALRLAWRAPQGCPSADAVRGAALRGVTQGGTRATLDADARVERVGDRWRVTLRTRRDGVAGERRFEAASCTSLADATAVVIALALVPPEAAPEAPPARAAEASTRDAAAPSAAVTMTSAAVTTTTSAEAADAAPTAHDRTGAREAAAGPLAAVETAPDRGASAPDRAATSPPGRGPALAVGAAFATDSATLPSTAAGGTATVAWTPGRARFELGGAFYGGQRQTAPAGAAGADFSLVAAGARGCVAVLRSAVEASPCLGADASFVSARGFGADHNYATGGAWVSAAGGLLVAVPIARWLAIRGQAEATVPFARPRFVVENDGTVYRPPTLGARATIGAELRFL